MPAPRISPDLAAYAKPIETLTPDPANLREHGPESIAAIAASLRRFGQQRVIVVDDQGVVRAGNGVLMAARGLGWTHVAAVTSDLVGPELVAYAIADNRAGEFSTWREQALSDVLGAMPADLRSAVGFDDQALAEMLRRQDPQLQEDQIPHADPEPAVTQRGDVWLLGEHRLMCGDSTSPQDVGGLMGKDRAMLCATDPPYLVDYTGVRAGDRGKDWSEVYREADVPDAGRFFLDLFSCVLSVLADNAAIYCWHAHKRATDILAAWRALGILDHQQIIWVKPSPVFGSVFWHFRHEPCLMGWRQGSKPPHDGRHDDCSVWLDGVRGRLEDLTREQLLELFKAWSSVWEVDWEGKARVQGNEHPTQKPLELFGRPMRKHTCPGDVVYEPFSGSGSQLIAAEQLGRRCRAMELQPVFVDVAIRRWQTMTGKSAKLAGTRKTWRTIAKDRGVEVPS